MKYRESKDKWVAALFCTGLALFLISCQGPGGDECGGIDAVSSCVTISSIQPVDGGSQLQTPDVDAVQDLCPDLTAEPFAAHRADVAFQNTPFPEFLALIDDDEEQDSLSVTIRRATIEYSLDFCPQGAVCPPLTGFTQNITLQIPAEGVATGSFDFVPLSVKQEFINQGGNPFTFPLYNVKYSFIGQTNFFNDTITLEGNAPFVIGNFDNCPEEES